MDVGIGWKANPSRSSMNDMIKTLAALALVALLTACQGSPDVSVCDIGKAGSSWNEKSVHLQATLVVDGNGGELHDERCPATILGFFEEQGDTAQTETYARFSSSFDRDLLSRGSAREHVELVGLIESPETTSGGRSHGSAVRLKKIISFRRLP